MQTDNSDLKNIKKTVNFCNKNYYKTISYFNFSHKNTDKERFLLDF